MARIGLGGELVSDFQYLILPGPKRTFCESHVRGFFLSSISSENVIPNYHCSTLEEFKDLKQQGFSSRQL